MSWLEDMGSGDFFGGDKTKKGKKKEEKRKKHAGKKKQKRRVKRPPVQIEVSRSLYNRLKGEFAVIRENIQSAKKKRKERVDRILNLASTERKEEGEFFVKLTLDRGELRYPCMRLLSHIFELSTVDSMFCKQDSGHPLFTHNVLIPKKTELEICQSTEFVPGSSFLKEGEDGCVYYFSPSHTSKNFKEEIDKRADEERDVYTIHERKRAIATDPNNDSRVLNEILSDFTTEFTQRVEGVWDKYEHCGLQVFISPHRMCYYGTYVEDKKRVKTSDLMNQDKESKSLRYHDGLKFFTEPEFERFRRHISTLGYKKVKKKKKGVEFSCIAGVPVRDDQPEPRRYKLFFRISEKPAGRDGGREKTELGSISLTGWQWVRQDLCRFQIYRAGAYEMFQYGRDFPDVRYVMHLFQSGVTCNDERVTNLVDFVKKTWEKVKERKRKKDRKMKILDDFVFSLMSTSREIIRDGVLHLLPCATVSVFEKDVYKLRKKMKGEKHKTVMDCVVEKRYDFEKSTKEKSWYRYRIQFQPICVKEVMEKARKRKKKLVDCSTDMLSAMESSYREIYKIFTVHHKK